MTVFGDQNQDLPSGNATLLVNRAPILALPDELLVCIFDFLWDCRIAASSACQRFRRAAAPHLFNTVSCVIDRPGPSFEKLIGHPNLLRHVRTLNVRLPLRVGVVEVHDEESAQLQRLARTWSPSRSTADLIIAKRAWLRASMPQLHTIRYCGSLASCLLILHLGRDSPVHVILENVWFPATQAGSKTHPTELSRSLSRAIVGQDISLGYLSTPLLLLDRDSPVKALRALRVSAASLLSDRAQTLDTWLPLSVSTLQELVLHADGRYHASGTVLSRLQRPLPWSQLLRLCIQDNYLMERLMIFDLPLANLRSLRILLDRCGPWVKFAFHRACQYLTHDRSASHDVDFFAIDFSCLPSLTTLEIEGICNHVPISNLVGPTLRALRLHAHHYLGLTLAPLSQRSPADIARIAQIAPNMERLELDIGDITNLWHSTSIPGVDVDMGLYSVLTNLALFKHLHTLCLLPHYVEKGFCSQLANEVPATNVPAVNVPDVNAHMGLPYKQAIADADAVAMFDRLRTMIPTLEHFSILPSDPDFWAAATEGTEGETDQGMRPIRFQAMAWHMTRWGDKTVLVTRQARKNYSQRQIWVGQRRLTTSILRDKYMSFDNTASSTSSRMVVDDGWILR